MKKVEFVSALAKKVGMSKKDATIVVDGFSEVIVEALESEGAVAIGGIGKLTKIHKDAHTAKNPKTGADITVGEKNKVRFKVSSTLIANLNK